MKISIRTISFGVIIIICIVAVVMAFYMQFGGNLFKGNETYNRYTYIDDSGK